MEKGRTLPEGSVKTPEGDETVKHYVLLKLAAGVDRQAAFKRVKETYGAQEKELPYLHHAQVYLNCVDRDSNADIMAVIDLDGPEFLQPYLTHPLHMRMAQDMKDSLCGRTSFDHE